MCQLTRWDGVPARDIDRFMNGCGITRGNKGMHIKFLRNEFKKDLPLSYLEKLSLSEKRTLSKWLKSIKSSPTQETSET